MREAIFAGPPANEVVQDIDQLNQNLRQSGVA
jgi:hypothetical protein